MVSLMAQPPFYQFAVLSSICRKRQKMKRKMLPTQPLKTKRTEPAPRGTGSALSNQSIKKSSKLLGSSLFLIKCHTHLVCNTFAGLGKIQSASGFSSSHSKPISTYVCMDIYGLSVYSSSSGSHSAFARARSISQRITVP